MRSPLDVSTIGAARHAGRTMGEGTPEGGYFRGRIGLARARAQGNTLGRPCVAPKVDAAVRAAKATGEGIRKIARERGIGVGTVQWIVG
jgi:hypothetical protein